MQKACDKMTTLTKIKTCAQYTMICLHLLVWGIVLEISNEKAKKSLSSKIMSGNLQQIVERSGLDSEQQHNHV